MQRNHERRSSKAKLALLRTLPAFAGCSDKELAEAARYVDDRTIPAGTRLTNKDELGHEAFLIVDGQADVLINGEKVAELGTGEFVGEMSMVDHRPRSATVVARTAMTVLIIGPGEWDGFASQRAVAHKLTKDLTERLRRADAKVAEAAR